MFLKHILNGPTWREIKKNVKIPCNSIKSDLLVLEMAKINRLQDISMKCCILICRQVLFYVHSVFIENSENLSDKLNVIFNQFSELRKIGIEK